MSDEPVVPPPVESVAALAPDPAPHVAAIEALEKAEAAATRRRWINLGEFIAVAGLIVAGISLYLNWSDRRADQADRQIAEVKAARADSRFDVRAVATADGKALVLQHDDRHPIRDATVTFPAALGVGSKDTVGDSIDRGWFEHAVLKANDGGPDKAGGRLPVLIALTYWDGDVARTTHGIYDIGWRTTGGFPFGRTLRLENLRLHEPGGTQARLDAIWAAEQLKH